MKRRAQTSSQLVLGDVLRRPRKRRGRGRPRGRKTISHDTRPEFPSRYPQHVTWRLVDGVSSLRRGYLIETIREMIWRAQKDSFRIVEFSIQGNHTHFVTEAANKRALARGLQGLARRLAPRLNAKLRRTGKLFATRYHSRILKNPREVKLALRYVLLNARRHAAENGDKLDRCWVDPYSSGAWFTGWAGKFYGEARALAQQRKPTADAQTWLLAVGWKEHWGPIPVDDVPGEVL
jgi:REP element-mobilizing transposase RayT